MSNSLNLALDVTKTGIQNPLIKVRQGDGGFETLRTTVTANGEPMDLQGWTITFMGTTAGNHKIVDGNVKLIEGPNGIFDYTPSKAWGMDIGEFKIAYFKFVKGDGSASSANFRVNVIEAVDLTQEEAQNYISVVDTTIAEINQHLTDSLANVTQSIADANANANTVASNVTTLGNRVDDYNNKLSEIKVGGRNLYINATQVPGFVSTSGTISVQTSFYKEMASDYIPVLPNTQYIFQAWGSLLSGQQYWAGIGQYDANKTFLNRSAGIYGAPTVTSDVANDYEKMMFTTDANTYFVRVSSSTFGKYKIKFEKGNIPTDWTPAPEDAPSNDAQLVHKIGTETIAGDKTFTSPINGQLSGNAATATKWQTARTLELTGDVTGSVSVDGSSNVSIATNGANLVHKTGVETIDGDKTFTGTVNAAQKVYTKTIGSTRDILINYTRVGNVVTGRYAVATAGTFTLTNNDGYKSTSGYPVNVITYNANAWFTIDNKFTSDKASTGNFVFITNDPLPAN